jgi:hypothetical protein
VFPLRESQHRDREPPLAVLHRALQDGRDVPLAEPAADSDDHGVDDRVAAGFLQSGVEVSHRRVLVIFRRFRPWVE